MKNVKIKADKIGSSQVVGGDLTHGGKNSSKFARVLIAGVVATVATLAVALMWLGYYQSTEDKPGMPEAPPTIEVDL